MYFTSSCLSFTLSGFSVSAYALHLFSSLSSLRFWSSFTSCSFFPARYTGMSSVMLRIPLKWSNTWSTLLEYLKRDGYDHVVCRKFWADWTHGQGFNASIQTENWVLRILAFKSSGRRSSITGSWYLSFFSISFSGLGSIRTLSALDFFVETTTLLTQAPSSRSSSALNFSFRATGILLEGDTIGVELSSISRWIVLGQENFWALFWKLRGNLLLFSQLSVVCWHILQVLSDMTLAQSSFCLPLSVSFVVQLLPSNGVRLSRTVTNSTKYFFPFLGFSTIILAVPLGFASVLFHMISIFVVGVTWCLSIKASCRIFIDAPQSVWNCTCFFLTIIFVWISFR